MADSLSVRRCTLQVFDKNSGVYLRQFGSRGEGNGQLQYPNGVAVDGAHLYVTEKGNHRVQVRRRSHSQSAFSHFQLQLGVSAGDCIPPPQ